MDENRSVEVEVRYRSHDIWIYALTRYFAFTQVWYFFIAFTIYGLFLTFILLKGNPGMFHILETLVTAILSVIIFGLITSYLSSYSGWAKRNRPFTFVFQPELVKLFSEKANSYMQWNYFVKAHETALRFRLYTHNKDQYSLPKRAFAEGDIEKFRQLLIDHADSMELRLIEPDTSLETS